MPIIGMNGSGTPVLFLPLNYDAINLADSYSEAPNKNASDVKVGFRNMAVLYLPGQTYNAHVVFPAKPDVARKLDGDLRLAIATRIKSPCFAVGHGHISPTSQFNYDMTKDEMGFVGSPESEWILYRATTKEVLKRGKLNMKDKW